MKRFLILVISLAIFLQVTTVTYAQTCGDFYTVGNCYSEAGCAAGSMCKADGSWPIYWNYRCENDQRCIQPPPPPANTTAECGLERTVNGTFGCFADDNGIIVNHVNCQGGGQLCCRTDASCPAANTEPTGCGILTNNNNTCRINGQDTGDFERCGQTNGCCNGISCPQLPALQCGGVTEYSQHPCNCAAGLQQMTNGRLCCGWANGSSCQSSSAEPPTPGGGGSGGGSPTDPTDPDEDEGSGVDIFKGPTSDNFRDLNPLANSEHVGDLSSPGGIVSRLLLFAFPLAGLILFVMIVWGGFEMLTSAASKGIEAGKQRVTAALIGFTLLFVAYWVFQIVEVIFGVVIL